MKFFVGIDIGGTKTAVTLISEDLKIVKKLRRETDTTIPGVEEVGNICKLVDEVFNDDVVGIGVGCAGPLDPFSGVIGPTTKDGRRNVPPNLQTWEDVPLKRILEEKYRVKVNVENDASAAGLGEALFGAGKGCNHIAYFTVSTGIGGAVIIDKKIFQGNSGNSAEFGAQCLHHKDGDVLSLENLSSGTSIGKISGMKAEEVFELAKNGDAEAMKILDESLKYLGVGVANVINFMDPDKVVLGGGVTQQGSLVLDKVKKIAKGLILNKNYDVDRIVLAELGDNVGDYGAIAGIYEENP